MINGNNAAIALSIEVLTAQGVSLSLLAGLRAAGECGRSDANP